ncbi:MAG: glycosyl hydrolase family 18 protein [Acidobacteriota bacterium]
MASANLRWRRRHFLQAAGIGGALGIAGRRKAHAQDAAARLRKTVYGWFPAHFGSWETSAIQWDALTHICFRSVVINGDGSVSRPAGNPPRAFVDAAHQHGVRVCVLVWVNMQQDSDSYLANYRQQAAQNLLAYVRDNGLDGVAYDDERWTAANGPLMSQFLQTLSRTFKDANPDYHLAFAAPPVISANDRYGVNWFDWPAAAEAVDAIVPMLYTANPPSIGWTTSPEPLAGSQPTQRTVARDIVTLMADYYEAVAGRRDKLLLGVSAFPWPGYEFRCRTPERLSPILERGVSRPLDYLEAQARKYGKRRDWKQQAAWYVYQDGDQFVQGWYDDEQSWAAKLDYVNQEELGGVGIWVLDGASDAPAMWDLLRAAFGPVKPRGEEIA